MRHYYPERYQKKKFQKHYFEGWYFKCVSADCRSKLSIIPSVSFSGDKSAAHLQVISYHQATHNSFHLNFPIESFRHRERPFSIAIDNSVFSLTGLTVGIDESTLKLNGHLQFSDMVRLNKHLLMPNIMGWFSYIPRMECNHAVISMRHRLKGKLSLNDQIIDFTNGLGYLEKDWGRSFPKRYVWLQSNHFKYHNIALFASVAAIPLLGASFQGFICNLLLDNQQIRLATYTGAQADLIVHSDQCISLVLTDKKYHLELIASTKQARGLLAPHNGSMQHIIKETLQGTIQLVLKNRRGHILIADVSEHSAIEIVR